MNGTEAVYAENLAKGIQPPSLHLAETQRQALRGTASYLQKEEFTIQTTIHALHHSNRIKDTIISTIARKAFDKTQHCTLMKTLDTSGMERFLEHLIKGIYKKAAS